MNGKELLMLIIFGLIVGGMMSYFDLLIQDVNPEAPRVFADNPFSDYVSGQANTDDLGVDVSDAGVNVDTGGFFSILENIKEGLDFINNNPWLSFALNTVFFIKNLLVAMGVNYWFAVILNVIMLVIFVFLLISWIIGR